MSLIYNIDASRYVLKLKINLSFRFPSNYDGRYLQLKYRGEESGVG